MIELRVDLTNAESIAQAGRVLDALAKLGCPPVTIVTERRVESAPKIEKQQAKEPGEGGQATNPTAAKAEAKAKAQPKEPAQDDLTGETTLHETPPVSRDEVAKAIVLLNKKKGRAAAVAVLEKYRPKGMPLTKTNEHGEEVPNEVKLPDVAKENYAALWADARAATPKDAQ